MKILNQKHHSFPTEIAEIRITSRTSRMKVIIIPSHPHSTCLFGLLENRWILWMQMLYQMWLCCWSSPVHSLTSGTQLLIWKINGIDFFSLYMVVKTTWAVCLQLAPYWVPSKSYLIHLRALSTIQHTFKIQSVRTTIASWFHGMSCFPFCANWAISTNYPVHLGKIHVFQRVGKDSYKISKACHLCKLSRGFALYQDISSKIAGSSYHS